LKFRIIGFAHFTGDKSELDITTSTSTKNLSAKGFIPRTYGTKNYSYLNGCNIFPSCPSWSDQTKKSNEDTTFYRNFITYTWTANKSLSGNAPEDEDRYGMLE